MKLTSCNDLMVKSGGVHNRVSANTSTQRFGYPNFRVLKMSARDSTLEYWILEIAGTRIFGSQDT